MEAQIAMWLYDKIMAEGWVTQSDAVGEIARKFGDEYTYTNINGNPAISQGVLKEFSKLKKDTIVWNRSSFEWHVKTDTDRELERLEAELPRVELPKTDMPEFDLDIQGDIDPNIK